MTTGLTTKQWNALSEPWSPTTRAVALELLIWTWEHKTPLPNVPKTLQRLSRVDDGRAFRQAWIALTLPNVGLFVEGTHGWTCPLQDAARGLQEARSRAGKVSAEARRRAAKMTAPDVRTDRSTPVPTGASPPSYPQPVENLLKTGGKVVGNPESAVEIGPPQTPPLTSVRTASTEVPEQEHGPPAAGAAFLRPDALMAPDLDTVALYVAAFVLDQNGGGPMKWDAFRDAATAVIDTFYELPKTAPKLDRTDLTYRVWDETFLGAYRDRFVATAADIRLAAPIA